MTRLEPKKSPFPFGEFLINQDGLFLKTDEGLIREGQFKNYLKDYFPLPIVVK